MNELLDEAIKGNIDAYAKLIDLILADLYKVASTKLYNIEDVNDAIHETILKSFKNLKKLREKKYFKTWITKILINECNNIYRVNMKQNKIFKALKYKISYEKTEIEMTEDDLDFNILLKPLNDDEKLIIVLYYYNKFTTNEIANILNTNVNTIRSRLLRAKEKIKLQSSKGGVEHYEKRR